MMLRSPGKFFGIVKFLDLQLISIMINSFVKVSKAVTPANAGVQSRRGMIFLDSRVRGNDENGSFVIFYMGTMIDSLVKIKKFAI